MPLSYAGIDYSLTSPAICVYTGIPPEFSIDQCKIYYFANTKAQIGTFLNGKLVGEAYPEYSSEEERHNKLAQWTIDHIQCCHSVLIEGYAFAAKGLVFNLAENCGVLKHKLWQQTRNYSVLSPMELKKYATSKGNADKERMDQAFVRSTGINMKELLKVTEKQWSPSSDIIDAFFLCRYLVEQVGGALEDVPRPPKNRKEKLKKLRAIVGKKDWKVWSETPIDEFDGFTPKEMIERRKYQKLFSLLEKR